MTDTDMPDDAPSYGTSKRSAQIAKLAAALAAATKAFAPISKDREVEVRSDRGNYKFKYATLDAIRSAIMPALAEQGLCIVQGMVGHGNGYAMETTLYHSSGEWVANVTPMFISGRVRDGKTYPPTNQELGSGQSYARRYGLTSLLCLAADEDDDANSADGNAHKPGVPGMAGGGPDFRPAGPRRYTGHSSANGRRMANDDVHLVDDVRQKGSTGTPPPMDDRARKIAAKSREWVDTAVATLKLTGHTVDSLSRFLSDHHEKIQFLEDEAPAEHDRFFDAYNEAADRARAVAGS